MSDESKKYTSVSVFELKMNFIIFNQVIVVVLDDWTVSCYDHELNLKWSRTPMEQKKPRNHYMVKAMGVLISPYSLQKGDNGSVIVGGSYGHRDHDSRSIKFHCNYYTFKQTSRLSSLFFPRIRILDFIQEK